MVKVNGKSIIERQLETMHMCGIRDEDITVVVGYCNEVLREHFKNTSIHFVVNEKYEITNMAYSLMCAKSVIEQVDDILISYGDIIYDSSVLKKILFSKEDSSVIVDDGWYEYWLSRCENPLDDAETLIFDAEGYLTDIGQKTDNLNNVQSQYIGLMRFQREGLKALLEVSAEAEKRSCKGQALWRITREYQKMYMTDLLQGMIDEGKS